MSQEKHIYINQEVGQTVNFGPIPAKQLPMIGLSLSGSIFCLNILVGINLAACILFSGWLIATAWLLTGNKGHRYMNRLSSTPRWTRGFMTAKSLFEDEDVSTPQL